MRKSLIVFGLVIAFFIIYFFQVNIFPFFTIWGVRPNLLVIFILFIGLFTNRTLSMSFAVIFGIMIDLTYSKEIGVTAIMFCIVAYLASYFDKNFSKESRITIIIMVAISTVIYEIGRYFLDSMIIDYEREMLYFTRIMLLEVLYNVLLTIIAYPLIQKIGYVIDRNFKENNILTRYF